MLAKLPDSAHLATRGGSPYARATITANVLFWIGMLALREIPPARPQIAVVDDKRLVSEVLAKDRKATAEFVRRCVDFVYPYVRRRLMPNTALVEDLVQEILLAAWQNLANFRGENGLRPWFLGIARHKVEDYYRKRIREVELDESDESTIESGDLPKFEEQIDAAAQQERVQETLAGIPGPYAAALLWRYRDNKSLREMAQLTGKTEKAMESLLARARETFRRRWTNVQP